MGCGCGLGSCNVKLRASLISAALFAVIASPQLFAFMQSLLGGLFRVASPSGAPTLAGLALHALVYGLIVYIFMHRRTGRFETLKDYDDEDRPIIKCYDRCRSKYPGEKYGKWEDYGRKKFAEAREVKKKMIEAEKARAASSKWGCRAGLMWGWGENSGKCCEAGNKNCRGAEKM